MKVGPTLAEAQRIAAGRNSETAAGLFDVRGIRGSSNIFISRTIHMPYSLPVKADDSPGTLQEVDGSISTGIVGWND